jgi:hypothetical protein
MISREELGKWLKKELGVREAVFDALWQDLESRRWLSDYDQGGCSEHDLLDAAQEALETYQSIASATGDAAQLSPPGRDGREVPKEVSVQLDDYTQKRAKTFSQLAAALADTHPGVREFRKRVLGGENVRLTEEQASQFLYEANVSERQKMILDELSSLAKRLSRAYRWREDAAKWFVLTGGAPYVQPLSVTVSDHVSIEDYYPNTASIALTVEAWVDAKDVERVYRDVQRQVLGGDNRKKSGRTLDVVLFIARQIRDHGREAWSKRVERWNKAHPERSYKSFRELRQVYERFLHPSYNAPKYKPSKREPWQVQRDKQRRRLLEEAVARFPPVTIPVVRDTSRRKGNRPPA